MAAKRESEGELCFGEKDSNNTADNVRLSVTARDTAFVPNIDG